jgi:hypothetical protein
MTGKLYNEDCAYVNELTVLVEGLGVVILRICADKRQYFLGGVASLRWTSVGTHSSSVA